MKVGSTLYRDIDFTKDSVYIYAVCAIDARNLTSGYSLQMQVSFDKKSNKIVLNYKVPVFDTTVKRNKGIKLKKRQKYLGNWSLDNYKNTDFSDLVTYVVIRYGCAICVTE